MTPSETQQLALLIEADAIQLRDFIAVLEKEQALLLANDVDNLLALMPEKTDRYQQLQRLHDKKAVLLEPLEEKNIDLAIRKHCADIPRILNRWDEVLQLARTAQEHNILNGKLITERLQHNQTALSVLLTATNQPQLYDEKGSAHPAANSRSLGSA